MPTQSTDPASLDRLHDIVELAPVSWWPPAPGWYGLAAILLLLAIGIASNWARNWLLNRYRRAALVELQQLRQRVDDEPRQALDQIAALVKRVALTAWPRESVANLTGNEWLEFLDATGRTRSFTQGDGKVLSTLTCDPQLATQLSPAQVDKFLAVVKQWIEHHEPVMNDNTNRHLRMP